MFSNWLTPTYYCFASLHTIDLCWEVISRIREWANTTVIVNNIIVLCIHCCLKLDTNNAGPVSMLHIQSQELSPSHSLIIRRAYTKRVDVRLFNRVWLINQCRPRCIRKVWIKYTSLFNPPKYISLCCQCKLCQYFLKQCFENVSDGGGGLDGSAPSDG